MRVSEVSVIYIYIYIYIYTASNSEKINIDFVCKIVNFGSPNLIILKKKFKNTTK